jgi:large subunit ribosomal protein L30
MLTGVMGGCLLVIRLCGSVGIPKEVERIFKYIHLQRRNHGTIIINNPSFNGTLERLKDYATWGEISKTMLSQLIMKRGKLMGGEKITDEYVNRNLGFDSIIMLSEAIHDSKLDFWKIKNVKPLFRLHPPKGGFRKKTNKHFPKGELGYRANAIDDLLKKMM